MSEGLASFDRPPVVETVLGVQFKPLKTFRNAHLGAFWKYLGTEEWPEIAAAPTLDPVFERFEGSEWSRLGAQIKLTQDPSARILIRNDSGDRMIQLQNGRLHHNWIGHMGDRPYPRYVTVRPEFDRVLAQFSEFLAQEGLSDLVPTQWEVTYVNHIPKGTVWNSSSDWQEVFVSLPGVWQHPDTIRPESFTGEWHFEVVPRQGRIHVQLQHGRARSAQATEMLRLVLTCRGTVPNGGRDGLTLEQGLDLGHETIVKSFVAMTTPEAHQYWGRRHDDHG